MIANEPLTPAAETECLLSGIAYGSRTSRWISLTVPILAGRENRGRLSVSSTQRPGEG